jgi:hypothetical protein
VLPPPAAPEADLTLARALWRLKSQAEEVAAHASASPLTHWETFLTGVAGTTGMEVMPWQAGLWQLQSISRPCLIEVMPDPTASRPSLWVLARGLADGVLIYQEPEGLTSVPLQRLRQLWYGKLYLTMEEGKYRGVALKQGMNGERVRALQHALKEQGYFAGTPSGQFDAPTQQAVKRFQRDNQLVVDGYVGRQTLIMLLHFGGDALGNTT